jgi:hypothetical protein
MSQREEAYSAFSSLWSSELYENSSTTDEDNKDDAIVFFAAVAAAMHNQEQRRLVPHDQQHFQNKRILNANPESCFVSSRAIVKQIYVGGIAKFSKVSSKLIREKNVHQPK